MDLRESDDTPTVILPTVGRGDADGIRSFAACHGFLILDTMRPMSNDLAGRLAPLTALDERGAAVTLGHLWRTSPVVLAFVRHFG